MSKGFGIDIYGVDTYGYSQQEDYSVSPFVASQSNYSEISLTWASPNVTAWKLMHLVRSVYGFPTTAEEGILIQEITPSTMSRTYADTNLIPGTIYYYSMFITLEAPDWNSSTAYLANSQVLYNGMYWSSTQNSNLNHTPTAGSSFWASTNYVPTWLPAGNTATLALGDQGYGFMLYDRTPQPYKISTSDTFNSASIDNPALQHYLSVFGFGLDTAKASYDSYLQNNNPDTVSAANLDMLGQQLGIATNYLSTPQQRRQRIKNATVNYRMKGQSQSIHNLIAELTGWDSEITYSSNMYNTADQTAFVHPVLDQWSQFSTYFNSIGPPDLVQYNGYDYRANVQTSGLSQAPSGTTSSNTWWTLISGALNSVTYRNPATSQISSWGVAGISGTTAAAGGTVSGLPHPTDSSVHNWHALSITQTNNIGTGVWNLDSTAPIVTPNYSAAVNYVINNNVLYTDGYYYRAVKPSGPGTPYGAITPGRNQTFWQPFYYTTSDRPNIIKDGIVIPQIPYWNPAEQYSSGQQVQYLGIVYVSVLDNVNMAPSGFYSSNSSWAFISPAQKTVVSSGFWSRLSNNVNAANAESLVYFYDKLGNLINNTAIDYTGYNAGSEGFTARFVNDYTNLNGTSESSLANAQTDGTIISGNWVATPGTANLWRSSYGMASVNQTLAGTTTYVYALIDPDVPNGRVCVTFSTDYADSAHKTHGVVFAWINANNFYYVTRTSLRKVTAGVDSLLSSWTRLSNGDRIVVDAETNITVYKYARTGDGNLTRLALSSGTGPGTSGAGKVGLIQKYSATGAL